MRLSEWMIYSSSSESSEGGILPTLDSSSESSGYVEVFLNSLGLEMEKALSAAVIDGIGEIGDS